VLVTLRVAVAIGGIWIAALDKSHVRFHLVSQVWRSVQPSLFHSQPGRELGGVELAVCGQGNGPSAHGHSHAKNQDCPEQ
jgi:hypothetical protein